MAYPTRGLLSAITILILSVLSIAIAATVSPSLYVDVIHNHFDARLSGLAENGWSTPDFGFYEPRVSSTTANVEINYAGTENKDRHPKMRYYFNSEQAISKNSNNSILLKADSEKSNGKGIKITSKSLNPFFSPKSKKHLGAKYKSVKIVPKFLFIFPTINFALPPFVLISALLTLLTLASGFKRYSLLPALVASPIAGLFLGQNRFDYWHRGFSTWAFICLLLCGVIIYRYFKFDNIAKLQENKKITLPILLIIFLISLFIRFQGLSFGLPALFHPDESRKSKIIRNIVETGDLNPHYFRHPNFLYYASAFNNWAYSKITGSMPEQPTVVYLGRCVSAVLGSFSVIIIFLIGRLLFNDRAGLIAAAFLSFMPLHAVSSRYIKEDACMLFFCLCSFYFGIRSLKNNCSIKDTLLSALSAGFSASSKYSGLLSIIFAMLPCYESALGYLQGKLPKISNLISFVRFENYRINKNIASIILTPLIVCIVFIVGFLIFTPYSVLDYHTFITDFMDEKNHMEKGHTVAISAISYYWGFHIERSILTSYQWIFAALSFIAAGYVFLKRKMFGFLLLCSVLLFYLPAEWVNAKPEPQPERYILPSLPFLILMLSDFISDSIFSKNKLLKFSVFVLSAAGLLQIAAYSYSHSQSIKNDTRLQAQQWIFKNIPEKSKIVTDWHFYGPPGLDKRYDVLQIKEKKDSILSKNLTVENLKASGYDYFVVSGFWYGRYLMPAYRSHHMSRRFRTIFDELKPEAVFEDSKYAFGFHNPEIRIFKIKQ